MMDMERQSPSQAIAAGTPHHATSESVPAFRGQAWQSRALFGGQCDRCPETAGSGARAVGAVCRLALFTHRVRGQMYCRADRLQGLEFFSTGHDGKVGLVN